MSRLPGALESLAVWPVVTGLSFLLRSPGFAYNEVVVALLDEPDAASRLRRFARLLSVASTGALLVMLLPLASGLWFEGLIGLPPSLAVLAQRSLWIALPLPAFSVLGALYQGLIVDSRKTRGITEAVALSLAVICLVLFGAVAWGTITGIYAAMAAFTVGEALRTVWLHRRSRPAWTVRSGAQSSGSAVAVTPVAVFDDLDRPCGERVQVGPDRRALQVGVSAVLREDAQARLGAPFGHGPLDLRRDEEDRVGLAGLVDHQHVKQLRGTQALDLGQEHREIGVETVLSGRYRRLHVRSVHLRTPLGAAGSACATSKDAVGLHEGGETTGRDHQQQGLCDLFVGSSGGPSLMYVCLECPLVSARGGYADLSATEWCLEVGRR